MTGSTDEEPIEDRLQAALAEVRSLREILPICSYCRKVRDDDDYWGSVEDYVARHTNSRFSHGICPDCMTSHVEPELHALENKPDSVNREHTGG